MIRYEVVIETFPSDKATALAMGLAWRAGRGADHMPLYQDLPVQTTMNLFVDVFHLGEIMLINDDGREVGYPGRKSGKWSVLTEVFDTTEAAVARAKQVLEDRDWKPS